MQCFTFQASSSQPPSSVLSQRSSTSLNSYANTSNRDEGQPHQLTRMPTRYQLLYTSFPKNSILIITHFPPVNPQLSGNLVIRTWFPGTDMYIQQPYLPSNIWKFVIRQTFSRSQKFRIDEGWLYVMLMLSFMPNEKEKENWNFIHSGFLG